MDFAGYVSICVQLYCVGFHRLSLHVSAYMAIFMCRIFHIHLLEGFCFAAFFFAFFFTCGHTLHVSICGCSERQ
jgi:hypothetical protein